jgi:hypothetical protein
MRQNGTRKGRIYRSAEGNEAATQVMRITTFHKDERADLIVWGMARRVFGAHNMSSDRRARGVVRLILIAHIV